MASDIEIKYYLGDSLLVTCYPGKRKEKKWKFSQPHDLLVFGYDYDLWLFLENGTRDEKIRTIGDLFKEIGIKDTIDKHRELS